MKKHYATHVEDTDKLISVAGPIKVVSSDFVMDKEFTIVGEWKLMADGMGSAGIVKPSSLVIMHIEHYDVLFPPTATLEIDGEEITESMYPFPVYTSPSLEFSNLLASEEWSSNEEEYDI